MEGQAWRALKARRTSQATGRAFLANLGMCPWVWANLLPTHSESEELTCMFRKPGRASWPLRFNLGRQIEFRLLPTNNLWTAVVGAGSDRRGFQMILNGHPVAGNYSMRPGALTEEQLRSGGYVAQAIDAQGRTLTRDNIQELHSYRLQGPANIGHARPTRGVDSGPSGITARPQHRASTPFQGTSAIPDAGAGSSRSRERGRGANAGSESPHYRSASTHSNGSVWPREFMLGPTTNLTLGMWRTWLVTPSGFTEPVPLTWVMLPAAPEAISGRRAFSRDDLLSGRFSVEAIGSDFEAIGSDWDGRPAQYALREREDQRTSSPATSRNAPPQRRTGTSSASTNTSRRPAQVIMKRVLPLRPKWSLPDFPLWSISLSLSVPVSDTAPKLTFSRLPKSASPRSDPCLS